MREGLIEVLRRIEPHIQEMNCRIAPASFDPHDPELLAFPRALDWQWRSCEDLLRAFGVHAVMMRLPLFWQVEALLHAACHAAGAPIFTSEPDNMPVAAAALRSVDIDCVVTAAPLAPAFADYLVEEHTTLPNAWILIHEVGASEWTVPRALASCAHVGQEVHLFPGVPLLWQCAALAQKKEAVFHVSEEFRAELGADATRISNTDGDLLPSYISEFPVTLVKSGACTCGRMRVRRRGD